MSAIGVKESQAADESSHSDYIYSYLTLRMTIGFVALILPVSVLAVTLLEDNIVLPSISDSFYHSFALSLFVGSMCAFAAFLWSYQFTWWEALLGNLGAIAAALVAIFPTSPAENSTPRDEGIAVVHYLAASSFFAILGIFCLLWWRSSSRTIRDAQASGNSDVYALSGVGILLAGLVALADKVLLKNMLPATEVARIFLLCEILMVEFFGLSWVHRGGVGARRSVAAAILATCASLLLIFGSPSPFLATITLALTIAVTLGLLWSARPQSSENRYVDKVRSTTLSWQSSSG